jgi:hypothetical protein
VDRAVDRSLRCFGGADGCLAIVAYEYGAHPDTAARRMRWALDLIGRCGGCPEHGRDAA